MGVGGMLGVHTILIDPYAGLRHPFFGPGTEPYSIVERYDPHTASL